jgi:hypothetical protein
MADGDDGLLGSPTTDQALKTALELTGGSDSGPGDLAQQGADIAIPRHGITTLAFAGRFVIARTDTDPFARSTGGAESGPIDADFDYQFGGGQPIDTGEVH